MKLFGQSSVMWFTGKKHKKNRGLEEISAEQQKILNEEKKRHDSGS